MVLPGTVSVVMFFVAFGGNASQVRLARMPFT